MSVNVEMQQLMGAKPLPAPQRPAVPGVSTHDSGDARLTASLNKDINLMYCVLA